MLWQDSIGDLMMNQMDEEEQPNLAEYIIDRNGVDFILSSKVLSAVDAKLRLEMGAEKILACILEPFREEYDYILIDTCPSLNTLTINTDMWNRRHLKYCCLLCP